MTNARNAVKCKLVDTEYVAMNCDEFLYASTWLYLDIGSAPEQLVQYHTVSDALLFFLVSTVVVVVGEEKPKIRIVQKETAAH